jgi:DNA-directed RNA polymerase specialized sigma24 family protein
VSDRKQNLPQLYRFCFLMLGDPRKAQEVFNATLREAALRAAEGELPREPFWLFGDARWRCLEASKTDLQPEALEMDEHDIAPQAASQIKQLDPAQLAIWISGAPDPQRTALALFYLDEFDYQEILDIAELKLSTLSRCLSKGRRQLQAWLDAKHPEPRNA